METRQISLKLVESFPRKMKGFSFWKENNEDKLTNTGQKIGEILKLLQTAPKKHIDDARMKKQHRKNQRNDKTNLLTIVWKSCKHYKQILTPLESASCIPLLR